MFHLSLRKEMFFSDPCHKLKQNLWKKIAHTIQKFGGTKIVDALTSTTYGVRKWTADFSSGDFYFFHFPVRKSFLLEFWILCTQFSVPELLKSIFSFKKFRYASATILRSFIATIQLEPLWPVHGIHGVRVQAYVRFVTRTFRSIRSQHMIPAVFICKLTTLLSHSTAS